MPALDPAFVRKHYVTFMLTIVSLSMPIIVLLLRNSSDLSDHAYIWVGWISIVLINVTLVTSFHLRKRQTERLVTRRTILIATLLALLSGLITTISISEIRHNNYLELALSNTPLNQIKPDRKRLIVELIRRNAAISAENNRIAKSTKPISPALYTVGSFASKEAMQSTVSQLKNVYEIDCAYLSAKRQIRQDFHNKMLKVDPNYLREFEAKMQDDDAQDNVISATEEKWANGVFSLYNYAIAHSGGISADNSGHLVVTDQDVRKSLLDQINASTTLEQTMSEMRANAVNKQHSLQDAVGISH
jgi:hypothetical protein